MSNHKYKSPSVYDFVDYSDDDSIPPPPPPARELERITSSEDSRPIKTWRRSTKGSQPEGARNDGYIPANRKGGSHRKVPMQGHFRGVRNAQQFDEEEAGMDEIEVPSSRVVTRINETEAKERKKRKTRRLTIIGIIIFVVVAAVAIAITIISIGRGGAGDQKIQGQDKTAVDNDHNSTDTGNQDDDDDNNVIIDVEPPRNVNMDTEAGRFLANSDNIPNSIKASLEDPYSFTSQALDWLLNDPANDGYPFDVEGALDDVSNQVDLMQRLALATIAKSMNVNADWNWLSNEDVCDWEGVICGFVGPDAPVAAEEEQAGVASVVAEDAVAGNKTISEIWMSEAGLNGTIPAEFALLSELTKLSLFNNEIAGTIPPELGRLSKLIGLDLFNNKLTGSIPPEIFTSDLMGLYLSYNQLTGSIPEAVGQMVQLQQIWMDFNQLTGGIPVAFGDLPNLDVLLLSGNQLTGGIPEEIGNAPLTILEMDNNPLFQNVTVENSTFPVFFKDMNSLNHLSLRNVELQGPFPQFYPGVLPNLERLYLDDNLLSGNLTGRGIDNLDSLVQLTLSGNQGLTGTIPAEIGDLKALEILDLSRCSFEGQIPMQIANQDRDSSLREIYVNDNNLVGMIPGSFSWLPKLEVLIFDDNNINRVHIAVCRFRSRNNETFRELRGGCEIEVCGCCTDVCE